MANTLGRISGQLLKDNLTRNDHDLAFDTDLLFLNVNSRYIGINTDVAFRPLLVNGTTLTTNLIVDTELSMPNITISSNEITSTDVLNFVASSHIYADRIKTDDLDINANTIYSLNTDSIVEIRPAGTGTVDIHSNVNITGDLYSPYDLTIDGNIIFGNNDQDSVNFAADINSDIVPNISGEYSLGTSTKKWGTLYSELLNGQEITLLGITSGDVDLTLRPGNTWYVATNGNDANVGDHQSGPFATVKHALSQAVSGDTVEIYPGTYTEIFPLTVPVGVTVKGASIRSVTIQPTVGTQTNDAFLLNGETTVTDLTVVGFYYDTLANTGYGFRFANNITVTSRSPYIQNVTVKTTTPVDPTLTAGCGALVDGSVANAASKEASMLFHSITFITPSVNALTITNGVRVEWLNSFSYFANIGLYAVAGSLGFASLGTRFGAELRSIGSANVYGNYGAWAEGAGTIMYLVNHNFAYIGSGIDSNNDASLRIQANETVELSSGRIYYQSMDNEGNFHVGDAFQVSFQTGTASIGGISAVAGGITAITFTGEDQETFINAEQVITGNIKFSGNTINSLFGPVNLSAQTDQLNLNNDVDVTRNVIISGDFNVDGRLIIGNQLVDVVEFAAPVEFDLRPVGLYTLGDVGKNWSNVFLDNAYVGDITLNGNTILSNVTDIDLELLASGTGIISVPTSDVKIDQILTVASDSNFADVDITGLLTLTGDYIHSGDYIQTGNRIVHGNLDVNGDVYFTDIAFINNRILTTLTDSDLTLQASGTGKVVFNDALSVTLDAYIGTLNTAGIVNSNTITADMFSNAVIEITNNTISTVTPDTDLILDSNGTGIVNVVNTDVEITQNLIVNDTTSLQNTNVTGKIELTDDVLRTGNITQTGDIEITGTLDVTGTNVFFSDIHIVGNNITTTIDDNDLDLRAAGTGNVIFNDNLRIVNDLTLDTLISNNIENDLTISTDILSTGIINIGNNTISTLAVDSDLTLEASGTGLIYSPTSSVYIDNDLTVVTGTAYLKDSDISGLIDLTGNYTQIGDYTQTGNRDISGTLTVTSDVYFDNINFIDNEILTTSTNSNLELRANGTGEIVFDKSLNILNDLDVDTLFSVDILNQLVSVNSDIFYTGDIEIVDNSISTTLTNSDLKISATGTGSLYIPTSNVLIENNLTVNNTVNFSNTQINDLLSHVGNTSQTGNVITLLGDFELDGDLTVNGINAFFKDIRITNNQIYTSLVNSNLLIKANGTGIINLNDFVRLGINLTVSGLTELDTLSSTGTILSNLFDNSDIEIIDNIISTTIENNNLILLGNAAGGPRLEKLKFNSSTISTDSANDNIRLSIPNGDLLINAATALKVPVGTSANRPTLTQGELRYNTTTSLYQGYSSANVSFGGVYSANLNTRVTAHPTANTLNFINNNIATANFSATGLTVNALQVDSLNFNNNIISSTSLDTDITFTPNGSGYVIVDDLAVISNEFLNLNATAPLLLQNTNDGYVKFSGTGGLVIPAGDNDERPTTPETGDMRWNTDLSTAEVFNGIAYQTLSGDGGDLLNAEEVQEITNLWALVLG